jgi:ribosomal-protein-alanine N-acetyltransferase
LLEAFATRIAPGVFFMPNPDPAPNGQSAAAAAQPPLATPRLDLRPIVLADAQLLHSAFADPETMQFMDHPVSRTVADTSSRIFPFLVPLLSWHATWIAIERATGAAIGFVNYHHRENWNRRLEIGFMVGRPFWGRGLAAEALTALIEHCFGPLEMMRIEATVQPENARAIALLERLGFRFEGGPLRRRLRIGDETRDLLIYGLLREEWRGGPPTGS